MIKVVERVPKIKHDKKSQLFRDMAHFIETGAKACIVLGWASNHKSMSSAIVSARNLTKKNPEFGVVKVCYRGKDIYFERRDI